MSDSERLQQQKEEQKERRREYMRKYRAEHRQKETEDERQKRLAGQRSRFAKYIQKIKKSEDNWTQYSQLKSSRKAQRRRNMTPDEERRHLYGRRLNYHSRLNHMNEDELKKKRKEKATREADRRNNTSEADAELRKAKHRDVMYERRYKYEDDKIARSQSHIRFKEAVRLGVLPEHSDFESDTGHLPFVNYYLQYLRLEEIRKRQGKDKENFCYKYHY